MFLDWKIINRPENAIIELKERKKKERGKEGKNIVLCTIK